MGAVHCDKDNGERREHSVGVSGNVIVNDDPPIKTNSYSHWGHDSMFVP